MHVCRQQLFAFKFSSGLLWDSFLVRTALALRMPLATLGNRNKGCFLVWSGRSAASWEWWLMMWEDLGIQVKLRSLRVCAC